MINKQMIVQVLIVTTAFYIYGYIRLKEISILNSIEQIKENTIAGSAFSARLGGSAVAFIPDRVIVMHTLYAYIIFVYKDQDCIADLHVCVQRHELIPK